jgi:hypothetical protein
MAKKKHGISGLVDRALHGSDDSQAEESQAQGSDEASPAVPKLSKPRKAGKSDPAEDFKQHPKFAKFKGEA